MVYNVRYINNVFKFVSGWWRYNWKAWNLDLSNSRTLTGVRVLTVGTLYIIVPLLGHFWPKILSWSSEYEFYIKIIHAKIITFAISFYIISPAILILINFDRLLHVVLQETYINLRFMNTWNQLDPQRLKKLFSTKSTHMDQR